MRGSEVVKTEPLCVCVCVKLEVQIVVTKVNTSLVRGSNGCKSSTLNLTYQ
jgi:hypothetical protein